MAARKATIDEIEIEARRDAEVERPAMTILPSGLVVIDEEQRALNSEELLALAEVRRNAIY